ncbi:cytochrome P450 monooxygenase [Flammula alnicola]|nr:cytochrome P450 monooxygenase [Flammula alnicola]
MDVEDGSSSLIFVVLGAAIVLTLLSWSERSEPNLKNIPALGQSAYLLSYIDALRFIFDAPVRLQRGYDKYRPSIFKIATLNRWLVIVTGTQFIEELRKATEDEVSLIDVANEPDVSAYFLGHLHVSATKEASSLARHITQNLTFLIADMRDEIVSSLNDALPPSDESAGWKEIDGTNLVAQITTRVANRVFIGPPFSRDKDYALLSASSACDVFGFKFSLFLSLLPSTFSSSYRNRRRMRKLLTSFIREQKKAFDARGRDHDEPKPNDLLTRILWDETSQTSSEDIASNLLNLSLTANQTLSMTFTHILYHLAANPKYAAPMRKEIEAIVNREGWHKHALEKMHKVDSFVKESIRMNGVSSLSTMRKTLKPFTFGDGTHVPAGALLATAARPRHLDASFYSSPPPDTFDGFRFSDLHEHYHGDDSILHRDGNGGVRFHLTTATTEYLAWGYGRHACPGRFFAAVLLKMMLAHVLLHYDVRFEDGMRPTDVVVGMNCLPDPHAKVLVRKRH